MAAADLVWIGNNISNEGDVNVAANWESRTTGESNRVPLAGDSIFFNGDSQYNCDTNLETLAAVALASINIEKSFIKTIGDGDTYFQALCSGKVTIGKSSGSNISQGSSRIMLDLGTTETDIIVLDTGNSSDSMPPLLLLAVNAASTLTIIKGKVGLAVKPGEVSTLSEIVVSSTGQASDAVLDIGSGVTVATIDKSGGTVTVDCGATTISQNAGTLFSTGSGAITNVNINGGTAYLDGSGTITNLTMTGGTTDMNRYRTAKTVTNVVLSKNATYIRDSDIVTETNGITTTDGTIKITGA